MGSWVLSPRALVARQTDQGRTRSLYNPGSRLVHTRWPVRNAISGGHSAKQQCRQPGMAATRCETPAVPDRVDDLAPAPWARQPASRQRATAVKQTADVVSTMNCCPSRPGGAAPGRASAEPALLIETAGWPNSLSSGLSTALIASAVRAHQGQQQHQM